MSHGVKVRCVLLLMLATMMLVLPACLKLWPRDSDKRVSETTLQKEVGGLVKIYRQCLQKYEGDPVRAKENCRIYKEAIQELAPEHKKSIVAELMDRLRDDETR